MKNARLPFFLTTLFTLLTPTFAAGQPPWLQGPVGQFLQYVFGNEQYWFDSGVFMLKFLLFFVVFIILYVFIRRMPHQFEEKHAAMLSLILSLIFTVAIPSNLVTIIYQEYSTLIAVIFILLPIALVFLFLILEKAIREGFENKAALATLYLLATAVLYVIATSWNSLVQAVEAQGGFPIFRSIAGGLRTAGYALWLIVIYFGYRLIENVFAMFSSGPSRRISQFNAQRLAKDRAMTDAALHALNESMQQLEATVKETSHLVRLVSEIKQLVRNLDLLIKKRGTLDPHIIQQIGDVRARYQRWMAEIDHLILDAQAHYQRLSQDVKKEIQEARILFQDLRRKKKLAKTKERQLAETLHTRMSPHFMSLKKEDTVLAQLNELEKTLLNSLKASRAILEDAFTTVQRMLQHGIAYLDHLLQGKPYPEHAAFIRELDTSEEKVKRLIHTLYEEEERLRIVRKELEEMKKLLQQEGAI